MSTRPLSITAEIELSLVVAAGANVPVIADLRYDVADPYAVHVGFHTGGTEVVEWTFARQLLTDGVTRAVGEGDVSVQPAPDGERPSVHLSLSSPSGKALFQIPLAELVGFLSQSYAAVPTGSESDYVDVDAELALLLWSEPGA